MLENLHRLPSLSALSFLRATKSCQRLKPVIMIIVNIIRLRRLVTHTHAKVQKIGIIGEHWARSKEQSIQIYATAVAATALSTATTGRTAVLYNTKDFCRRHEKCLYCVTHGSELMARGWRCGKLASAASMVAFTVLTCAAGERPGIGRHRTLGSSKWHTWCATVIIQKGARRK